MRNHRLFAAGLAAALVLGATSSALAAPGNGKAKGKADAYGQTKAKPAKPAKPTKPAKPAKPAPPVTKGKKYGVSGGGSITGGSFSMQAHPSSKAKGHFNYTSTTGSYKVRCRNGFTDWAAPTPNPVTVTFNNCSVTGHEGPVKVEVTVTDGEKLTPPAKDSISFLSYSGELTDGNVKIR